MTDTPPRLFISYSWTSPEHQEWVIDLATRLRSNGVDVILDVWDLREGHDSHHFMEKMVNDPTVTHVMMVSDAQYAAKADGREGGVGTETTIISREVYAAQNQSKFVVVLPPRDDVRQKYIPTYYGSKIFIDLGDEETKAQNYEAVLRWLYGRPLHVKPALGERPSFLGEGAQASLGTEVYKQRATEALRSGKVFAVPAVEEYLDHFASAIDLLEAAPEDAADPDDLLSAIERTISARNEFISMIGVVAQYATDDEMARVLHRFFERCVDLINKQVVINGRTSVVRDPVKLLISEIFMYTIVALLKRERYSTVQHLLSAVYYPSAGASGGREVRGYWALYGMLDSERWIAQHLRKTSARGYLLHARNASSGVPFESLMQADIFLWLRTAAADFGRPWWFPVTPIYSERSAPLELFARGVSRRHFENALGLLGAPSVEAFKDPNGAWMNLVQAWNVGWSTPEFEYLLALDTLGSRP
ncbi:TIR domain-containing protein [Stenotrophomonas pennii]|uniref:TIR domain-containing protein n=1 Tax=Stenotrophomonas lacuserhaii TaxID=2760084 RepID=UPI00320920F9